MAKKPRASKKQLGAGIGALLRNIDADLQDAGKQEEVVKKLASSVANIPLAEIEVNPHQPRTQFDEDGLKDLAESIEIYGIIQPITVRRLAPQQYQLISGERRFRASKLAKLNEVPAYVRLVNDQEMMEMALVENVQRENLNPMEMATTLARLKNEFSVNDDKLATIIGKRRSTITNYRGLLKLPPNIQEALWNEEISMGHARALVGLEDPIRRQDFFTKLIVDNLSVRALEKLIQEYREKAAPQKLKKTATKLPDDYNNVQNTLREKFGIKRIQLKLKSEGKGQITIPFNSVDDLNHILDVIED